MNPQEQQRSACVVDLNLSPLVWIESKFVPYRYCTAFLLTDAVGSSSSVARISRRTPAQGIMHRKGETEQLSKPVNLDTSLASCSWLRTI